MNKYIFLLLTTFTFSFAGLVNAIAVIINDTPITLYDIDQKMESERVSKQQAVSKIIDDTLYKQEIKNNNITIDILEIDDYIAKLANSNKMNVLDFKAAVQKQQNYEQFKEDIKKRLTHQKLVKSIASGNLKVATKEDIKLFYDNNQEQYKIADTIEVIAYVSKDKKLLEQLISNPMMTDENIIAQSLSFKQSELNQKVKYILNTTAEKNFSSIFTQNQSYNMFFVSAKKDINTIPLENVQETIFNQIMQNRENSFLKEHFESLKITADIQILR